MKVVALNLLPHSVHFLPPGVNCTRKLSMIKNIFKLKIMALHQTKYALVG
jgi:hypothetical protein